MHENSSNDGDKKEFYFDQSMINNSCYIVNADEFAEQLIRQKWSFSVISGEVGIGKTSALNRVAVTLSKRLAHHAVVCLDLEQYYAEIVRVQNELNTKDAAIELIREWTLGSKITEGKWKKSFDEKVKSKQLVILLDSLDKIGLKHTDTALKLICLLQQTDLQIVVSTLPQKVMQLCSNPGNIFELQPFEEERERKNFIRAILAAETNSSLVDLVDTYGLHLQDWGSPLMLTALADCIIDSGVRKPSMYSIYSHIVENLIQRTSECYVQQSLESLGLTRFTKHEMNTIHSIYKVLAKCLFFHTGILTEECREEIEQDTDFINKCRLARVEGDRVTFISSNVAEYFVAEMCVQLFQSTPGGKTTLSHQQLKCILLEDFVFARQCINGMLSDKNSKCLLDFDAEEKEKLLRICIEEDLFDLYLLLKDQIGFKLEMCVGANNPFALACKCMHAQFVHEFVSAGADLEKHIEQRGEIIQGARLFYAVDNVLMHQLKKYIEIWKKDINCRDADDKYTSPLGKAIKTGNIEVIKLLIGHGADVVLGLQFAAEFDQLALMKEHLGKIPHDKKRASLAYALDKAFSNGHLQVAQELCALGAVPSDLNDGESSGVHNAAREGHLECLAFAIEKGVHVDALEHYYETLLMFAAQNNRYRVVEYLLKMGADVTITAFYKRTCLHYAAQGSSLRCFEMLVEAGSEIDCQDEFGKTPLMYIRHSKDCVRYLLQQSANPNLKDATGRTCLHHAAENSDPGSVKLLAARVDNVDSAADDGWTPLHYAQKPANALVLLEAGANPNLKDQKGQTSLHVAAQKNNLRVVQVLVANNVDISAQDNEGKTALDVAAGHQNDQVVVYLRSQLGSFQRCNMKETFVFSF